VTVALRALLAEFVGTAFLLMTIVGSGIMGDNLANQQPGDTLTPHAIVIGAMLFVLIAIFGPVSGAHLNPAVTMIFLLKRELPTGKGASYVLAQIVGAVFGVLLAHVMFDLEMLQASQKPRSGIGQWTAEIVATAGLILVIFGGIRTHKARVPVLVGLYIMAALWFTSSTSFANPAVTLARMLTDTFSGILPTDAPVFIGCQAIGALIGWGLAGLIWPEDHEHE